MNNEPEAYINKDDGLVCSKCYKPFTKEITVDEILEFRENVPYTLGSDLIEFARAILR